jgi:hypothetical protein
MRRAGRAPVDNIGGILAQPATALGHSGLRRAGLHIVRNPPGGVGAGPSMNLNPASHSSKQALHRRIVNRVRSWFWLDQWIVLTASRSDRDWPVWADFTPMLPPPDRHWADPFVLLRDGRCFVFMEEKLVATNRGRIICMELDADRKPQATCVVLERPYHLSYPFVFEYAGQLYMLPETKENRAIELYRCTHFPDAWEFEKTLMADVRAVDATLVEYEGKWWMLCNIEEEGGSSWDTLCLYSADNPLSARWTPHPRNPIVKDIRSARPAGQVVLRDGMLIRPSQDCSVRYGYGINFNQITALNRRDYAEKLERTFRPPEGGRILATHTWNAAGDVVAIDAVIWRRRF